MNVIISPSLMCMNLLDVRKEIEILSEYAGEFHADILDYHYCKNLSLSPDFIKAVTSITDIPVEAHLYVDNIDPDLVKMCADAGASIVTMPPEVIGRQMFAIKRYLDSRNVKFGISLNPSVPVSVIEPYIGIIDRLIVLSVDPGFAGQPFIDTTFDRIREACALREKYHAHFTVASDGCCNEKYYKELYEAGADVFVLGGSGLFGKSKDTEEALKIAVNYVEEAVKGGRNHE